MDFAALEKHVIGVIAEQQIKLGYRRENVRLYYPLESLNGILQTEATFMEMLNSLEEFSEYTRDRLGHILVESDGERFCLIIPPQGSDYIHTCSAVNGFLSEFINTVRKHGCTLEDALKVFRRYSSQVHVECVDADGYDYVVYFLDGKPDDYRYCLSMEEGHLTYHRFTKEDYEQL